MSDSGSSWKTLTGRCRALATGRVEWVAADGAVEVEWLSWPDRWAVFGVHSYTWWWVRRFGARECGCTVNPLTRRRVLIGWECTEHGYGFGDV